MHHGQFRARLEFVGFVPALVSWLCHACFVGINHVWLLTLVDCVSTLVFVTLCHACSWLCHACFVTLSRLVIYPRGLCVHACFRSVEVLQILRFDFKLIFFFKYNTTWSCLLNVIYILIFTLRLYKLKIEIYNFSSLFIL